MVESRCTDDNLAVQAGPIDGESRSLQATESFKPPLVHRNYEEEKEWNGCGEPKSYTLPSQCPRTVVSCLEKRTMDKQFMRD